MFTWNEEYSQHMNRKSELSVILSIHGKAWISRKYKKSNKDYGEFSDYTLDREQTKTKYIKNGQKGRFPEIHIVTKIQKYKIFVCGKNKLLIILMNQFCPCIDWFIALFTPWQVELLLVSLKHERNYATERR